MKVLITGVTSFIGCALAKQLISEGTEVYGVVRPHSPNIARVPKKVHIIECDMDNIEELPGIVSEEFFACVHLAWNGAGKENRMDQSVQTRNKENTLILIKTLGNMGCQRFIFAGSQAEYGVTLESVDQGAFSGEPVSETAQCRPVSQYGKAKLEVLSEADRLCSRLGMTYIHLRIFSVYGKGDHEGTLVSSAAKTFAAGGSMRFGACTQLWNYINIRDCAKAIADMVSCVFTVDVSSPVNEHVVNIASEDTRPMYEFIKEIRDCAGSGTYELGVLPPREEGTAYLNPDISKLQKLTGYRSTVSFSEGVKEIINEENQCCDSVL